MGFAAALVTGALGTAALGTAAFGAEAFEVLLGADFVEATVFAGAFATGFFDTVLGEVFAVFLLAIVLLFFEDFADARASFLGALRLAADAFLEALSFALEVFL